MRTISELLTILRDNAEVEDNEISFGLCNEVKKLCKNEVISYEELSNIKRYIIREMPHSESIKTLYGMYGWPIGEWLPRLAWLNEHIELTKNTNNENY